MLRAVKGAARLGTRVRAVVVGTGLLPGLGYWDDTSSWNDSINWADA